MSYLCYKGHKIQHMSGLCRTFGSQQLSYHKNVLVLMGDICKITTYHYQHATCISSTLVSFMLFYLVQTRCRPDGTATLPRGIISKTTDLAMLPLRGPPKKKVLVLLYYGIFVLEMHIEQNNKGQRRRSGSEIFS